MCSHPSRLSLVCIATCLGIATLAGLPQKASAQANLAFSGGSGAPVTLTLLAPITYTINAINPFGYGFAFQGVGAAIDGQFVTGTISYSINGGAPETINVMNSGVAVGDLAANDTFIYNSLFVGSVNAGDTVLLSAGSITTTGNIAAAAPASGAYNTFMFEDNGTKISNFGIASSSAPEPGTLVLLALGTIGGIVARRRKS